MRATRSGAGAAAAGTPKGGAKEKENQPASNAEEGEDMAETRRLLEAALAEVQDLKKDNASLLEAMDKPVALLLRNTRPWLSDDHNSELLALACAVAIAFKEVSWVPQNGDSAMMPDRMAPADAVHYVAKGTIRGVKLRHFAVVDYALTYFLTGKPVPAKNTMEEYRAAEKRVKPVFEKLVPESA